MPSPEQNRAGTARTSMNPSRSDVRELLSALGTDPTEGLSPKEAEHRLETEITSPLFRKTPRTYAECVRQCVRDPALWLMAVIAAIALFFDRVGMGVFCLLLTLGNTALCAGFLYRADRTDAAMLAYDTPLCRVLRGRRIRRISADGLVVGDVILLRSGDIVPADCRLISSDGLVVLERELDASDPCRPAVRLEKRADQFPDEETNHRLSPVNMAYAGSMVEEGSATAVVVATGNETHLGGLIGYIPTLHQGKRVGDFKKISRILSVYNLCLFCFVVPLTAVGIFTVGGKYEFLDIFLSALALATLMLTEHMLARGIHLGSAIRRAAAMDRDAENTSEIKSDETLEKLTAMTDLLLVGTAALHTGESTPEVLRIGDSLYRCDRPDADDEVKNLAQYLYLYRQGIAALPMSSSDGDTRISLLDALCGWADIDFEALQVKIKGIRTQGEGVSGMLPAAGGSRRVTVRLTDRYEEAETCSLIRDGGVNRPFTREWKSTLYRAYREAVRQGSNVLFVLTNAEGETEVRGMITYAPRVSRKTLGCVKNLEGAGIRVTAFLRDTSDLHLRVLDACGLTEQFPVDRPAPDGAPRSDAASRIRAGCRAFDGCTTEFIRTCIEDLKREGRTVGVLSVDGEDVSLLAEADVAFTCAPSLYDAAESGRLLSDLSVTEIASGDADGGANGKNANDRSRRAAHVVIRRSSEAGGGMLGVLRALQAADGFRAALDHTARFVVLSQILRMVMTILPLCLGLAISAAPALLVSGLLVDLLALTVFLGLPLKQTPAPRRDPQAPLLRSPFFNRAEIVASVAGAILPWLVAGVAALCDVEFGGDLLYFGLLCTVGLQLVVFRTDRLPKRDSTVFLGTLALVLIYVGALAAALVGGLSPLWALVMPLVAPTAYLSALAIGKAAFGGVSK